MIHEGLITESFLNGMLSESIYILYNEDLILGYISGKIRRSLIQTLPRDRIKIEIRQYYSFNQGTYNL
uniref:translational initiation factor 1 n=1 Tax=Allium sacculiferum TaxID=88843 RepID=UPI0022FD70B4|nr:translational initiation factor 1 [Allium sacculiferum]YP_010876449.1 translational initiation factor 1 [Allium longistylum]WBN97527.1 translational initiation factor 1 [Allium sacculiferum]WHE17634.1 translational initiation factor 1 [Allium thunbergii var. deltoides]WHE17897.1 translational initiation factor 1 [Allium longistylum]